SLKFNAINNKKDFPMSSSRWDSVNAMYENRNLFLLFESHGSGRGSTQGTMHLQFHSNENKKQLIGEFNDSSPATHHGTIHLFSDISEYQDRLKLLNLR